MNAEMLFAFGGIAFLTLVYFGFFFHRVRLIKRQIPAVVSWRVYLLNIAMLVFALACCLIFFILLLWP